MDRTSLLLLCGLTMGGWLGFSGCATAEHDAGMPFATGGGGAGTAGSAGSGPGSGGTGGVSVTTGIVVEPSAVTIDVDNGAVSGKQVTFSAKLKSADGSSAPVYDCAWSLDGVNVGKLAGSVFQPSGSVGGKAEITCSSGELSGSAEITVKLHERSDGAALGTAALDGLIATTTTDPVVKKLAYPYDETVFPRGLAAPPELMWSAPSATDVYAVVFEEEFADAVVTFKTLSPGRFQPSAAVWNKLLESNPGKTVAVTLYRLAGGAAGTAYVGPKQTWTLSTANLKGTVYYWRVENKDKGDIVKMPFGQAPQPFLQSGGDCTGCHAVSRNGTVVAAAKSAMGYAGAFDTAGTNLFSTSVQSGYRAVSPDGNVIAWIPALGSNNYLGEPVELADAKTGQKISPSGMESFGLTSTPEFAPDGKALAFSVRTPPHDQTQHNIFNRSDLAIADFDPVTRQASNMKTLIATTTDEALVFPSFTPDAERVVFQRGNQVRSRSVTISGWDWTKQSAKARLAIVNRDGTNVVDLAAANHAGVDPIDQMHNFHPIMSPVVQGGYFWVVFTSSRTYGNRLEVTGDHDWTHCVSTGFADCRKKQIWVAAIDIDAKDGIDPSHPALWLPGQEVEKENFDAYWALDACKPTGSSCDLGFECCEGACSLQNGQKLCGTKNGCGAIGDTCSATAECCSGLTCIGGVCDMLPIK